MVVWGLLRGPWPLPKEGYRAEFSLVPTLYTAHMTREHGPANEIVVTTADNLEMEVSSGPMTRLAGVSELLTGSTGIHMAIANIPPGRCSTAHYHVNCESAIYVSKGKGRFVIGDNLDNPLIITQGDFIYVPAEAVHQPVNVGDEPLELIVARNTPVEIVVEVTPQKSQA